ncbi:MAG: SDR family oxidoreductase [Clostridia bacterium]|nr:SDR family oxidoreductase [Clostridia bacterium]
MNVLITGTAQGIGLAMAEKFLREGHRVWGLDKKHSPLKHPGYTHLLGDIRDTRPQVEGLNALINNAGTLNEGEALEVNLTATMAFTEAYLAEPDLKAVLFIASASARNGAEFPRYVAAKAGLVGYMKYLAMELGPRGVLVNSISPGGVVTPANEHILSDPRLYEAVKGETILGKWAEAFEVADLAYYLTAVNRSITGEDILMDNGEMLKSNFIW